MFFSQLALQMQIGLLLILYLVIIYARDPFEKKNSWKIPHEVTMGIAVSEHPQCIVADSSVDLSCIAFNNSFPDGNFKEDPKGFWSDHHGEALDVAWYLDNQLLLRLSSFAPITVQLKAGESTNYTCVTSSGRETLSTPITLRVKDPKPKITPEHETIRVNVRAATTLSCHVTGNLLSHFTWERVKVANGVVSNLMVLENPITKPHPELTDITIMLLELKNVTRNMEGTYRCSVQDCSTKFQALVHLTVHDVPKARINYVKPVGTNSVCLEWTLDDGHDNVTKFSVKRIEKDTKPQKYVEAEFLNVNPALQNYTAVRNLTKGTTYMFKIVFTNSMGDSHPAYSDWVTTFDKEPDVVPSLSIEGANSNEIGVQALAPSFASMNYTDYYEVMVTHDNKTEEFRWENITSPYVIANRTSASVYRLRISACNSCIRKCGESSNEGEVATLKGGRKLVPNLSVTNIGFYSITIGWSNLREDLRYIGAYTVQALSENDTKRRIPLPKTMNSHVFEDLQPNTEYRLILTACIYHTGNVETFSECEGWAAERKATTSDRNAAQVQAILWQSLVGLAVLIVVVMAVWLARQKYREKAARREFIEATLQRFNFGALNSLNPELDIGDQAELLPYDKKWEFPRELLTLDGVIGRGEFGEVRKAEARSICRDKREKHTIVAVKLVRATDRLHCMTALSRELKILANLGKHLNIVNLLGACTKNVSYGELFVILEFCRFGNLHDHLLSNRADFIDQFATTTEPVTAGSSSCSDYVNYLRNNGVGEVSCDVNSSTVSYHQGNGYVDMKAGISNRAFTPDSAVEPDPRFKYQGDRTNKSLEPICTQDLLCWAWQVIRAMEYLGSKKILHGDLAARNILLADHNVVKICDFGLARNLYMEDNYEKKAHHPLPIKWMAIESIRDRIFSVQSDIWSFGIVLWEFFTLAQTPYPGIDTECLYNKLVTGFRMEQPKYANTLIYQMMLNCWDVDPSKRPSFDELANNITELLDKRVQMHYTELSAPYDVMNNEDAQNGERDYLTMTPAELQANMIEVDV